MYIYIIYIACLSYLRTHRYNTKQSPGDITLQITATCLPGLEMGSLHTLVSLGLVVLSTTFGACRKFIFVLSGVKYKFIYLEMWVSTNHVHVGQCVVLWYMGDTHYCIFIYKSNTGARKFKLDVG